MKKWLVRIIILLLYSVPYMFLSMNGDATTGTMIYYGVMILAFVLLCYLSKRTDNKALVIIGNIISFITSLICLFQFRTEKWGWYFKPLTDIQLMITVSVVAFVIQFIIAFRRKKIGEQK